MDNNDDKIKFGSDSTPKMDDNYFDNLYDDLPKEIADLLKSNHPFAEHDDGEETLEEKRARRAAMRKEAKGSRREAPSKGSRRETEAEEKPERHEKREKQKKFDIFKDDIADTTKPEENIPDVNEDNSVKAEAKHEDEAEVKTKKPLFDESAIIKKAMEEANLTKGDNEVSDVNIGEEEESKQVEEIDEYGEEVKETESRRKRAERKRRKAEEKYEKYEEYDDDNKEAALARFFNDDNDYYDDERGGAGKVILVVLLIIAVAAAGFFGYKYIGVKGDLAQANAKLEQMQDSEKEKEELKLQILDLQSEIDRLKAEDTQGTETTNTADPSALETPEATAETTPASTESTYTVVDGDSYWTIAQKVYGDGTKYQKILDANGLKENDSLSVGQTLKIPSL